MWNPAQAAQRDKAGEHPGQDPDPPEDKQTDTMGKVEIPVCAVTCFWTTRGNHSIWRQNGENMKSSQAEGGRILTSNHCGATFNACF